MKPHPGYLIVAALALFIGFILFLAFTFIGTKVDLTSEDYYIKELHYESIIQAQKNSIGFEEKMSINQNDESIFFSFDKILNIQNSSGQIYFYKASNSDADKHFSFTPENPVNGISKTQFEHGEYIVKITWQHNNVPYYVEQKLIIY